MYAPIFCQPHPLAVPENVKHINILTALIPSYYKYTDGIVYCVYVDFDYKGTEIVGRPERTHWRPSKKLDVASIGIMVARYLTTCVSLL